LFNPDGKLSLCRSAKYATEHYFGGFSSLCCQPALDDFTGSVSTLGKAANLPGVSDGDATTSAFCWRQIGCK
jgi:hypothetical protein